MTDEEFYINELNFYTTALSKTYKELATATNKEDMAYLRDFITYCKDHIFFYAEKLTILINK